MAAGHPDLVFAALTEARLLVSCQSKFNPSDQEWDRWLEAAWTLERRVENIRLLVVTEGGHPTKPQIERLRAANKSNPPTAIVSPSLALRFLGSALTFVNPTIRCFSPAELEQALGHLGVGPIEGKQVEPTLERLRQQLARPLTAQESP